MKNQSLTRVLMAKQLANETNLTDEQAKKIINCIFEKVIPTALMKNRAVTIRGFGTFVVKRVPEKKARDINRNKEVIIPPTYKPVWRPSKNLKDSLNSLF